MATVAELLVKIGADVTTFQKSMQRMEKDLGRLGDRMQQIGGSLATSFGAMGAAIAAGIGIAVSTAADFEAQMSRVGAIANASGTDLQKLRDKALELGATTSKSASEVAVGFENLAAMGFEVNEMIAAMPGVISAAEASGEDMALVADTMAAALNTFKLEASEATRVADVLAQSANSSAADIQDMAYTFKYAAPVASSLGISLETLAAATGIMADTGIRGEQAGTSLRAALLRLADPPREAANKLRELGVSITDAKGNMLPFDQIVGQLASSLQGMGDAQKAAALSTIFGTEATSGMLAIIEAGPEKLRALTKELENSEGVSKKVAELMKQNLKGSFEELAGAIEVMQILFTDSLKPALIAITDALRNVVLWFNNLSPEAKQFIAIGAAVTASVFGLIGVLGTLIMFAGGVTAAFGVMGISMASVLPYILPVSLAIGALVAAGVQLYQNWETVKFYASRTWAEIQRIIQPAVDAVAGFITEKFTELSEWWHEVWPNLKEAFANVWHAIQAIITPIVNGIVALMKWAWPYVKMIIVETWEAIKGLISGVLNFIMGAVNAFAGLFTGNWRQLWEGVKQMFFGALEAIWNFVQLWGFGRLLKVFGKIGADVLAVFQKLGSELWTLLTGLLGKVVTWAGELGKVFLNLATSAIQWGRNIVEGLANGIESLSGWIKDKVLNFVEGIGMTIKEFFGIASPSKLTTEYGQYVAEGLAVGIQNKQGEAVAAARSLAQGVISEIEGAISVVEGRLFEVINGARVQIGGEGFPGGGSIDIPDDMPDWLKPPDTGGGGGGKKRDRGPDARDRNDEKYSNDDRYVWDEKEGRWWDNEDGGWEGGNIYPGMATGGTVVRPGLSWVGEEGPELLNLPRGAQVVPNYDLPELGGELDYDRLARCLAKVLPPFGMDVTIPVRDLEELRTVNDFFIRIKQTARARGVT